MAGRGDLGRAQALLACALVAAFAAAAGSAAQEERLGLVLVADGLRQPVQVVSAPGEPRRLYVVERAGRVRVVEDGRLLPEAFADIRPRVRSGGLLGMLSIAFHPRYPVTRRLYAMYTGGGGQLLVAELRRRAGRARLVRVLLRVRTSPSAYAHVGGQLAFGPGGLLNVGIGDGLDPASAQDPESMLGKILRLDVDRPGRAPGIVAMGLRNPWRLSFDRTTGDLYVGDVGERTWEEVDVIRHGTRGVVNFGWDAYEGPVARKGRGESPPSEPTPPFVFYRHPRKDCAAVVGGFVYRGPMLAGARGRYFYGDTCSGAVWSVPAAGRGRESPRREPFVVPQLVSFGEDGAGELYVVAIGGGQVARIAEVAP